MAPVTATNPSFSKAKWRLRVDREREIIQKSYPNAQLPTQNGAVLDNHTFITSQLPKYAAQKQSMESVKVLLYCAIVRILLERSNLPPDAFQKVTMDPDTGIVTYDDFIEASRGGPSDGLKDGEDITVFKVGKYKRTTDLIALLEKGIFPEIEKGVIASLQLLMCLVDERPTNVVELWTFSFNYGEIDEEGPKGPNFVRGMVRGVEEGIKKQIDRMLSHVQVDSLVRRAGGLANNVGNLATSFSPFLKHALKYYFYLHYNELREKGAMPVGFDSPPLPTLNFVSTFEYGLHQCLHRRVGYAAQVDSYVKVGLGVNMLEASKASLTDSENTSLGRPVYLTEVTQEEEMKFAAYQTWQRRHFWDDESEWHDEPSPSGSPKRQRTTKAKSKQSRVKTADMSSQTKQDRSTRTQLRTMNVPSTQATNAGPTQSESSDHGGQSTRLEHPKIKRNVLAGLRSVAGDRNLDALGVLTDGGPERFHRNGESDFTLLDEIECLCSIKSVGPTDLIRCSYCHMWQHTDCVGFLGAHDVQIPDQYLCTLCWTQLKHLDLEQVTELKALLIQKQVLGYLLRNDYPIGDTAEVARVVTQGIVGTCTAKDIREISAHFWRKKILRELARSRGFDRNLTPSYSLYGIGNDYGHKPKKSKTSPEERRAEAVAEVMNPMLHISHLYTYGAEEEQSGNTDTVSATGKDKDHGPNSASGAEDSPDYAPQASIEDLPEDEYPPAAEYSSSDGDSIPPEPVPSKRALSNLSTGANIEVDAPATVPHLSESKKPTLGHDDNTLSLASNRIPGALSRPLFLDDSTNTTSSNIDSSDFEL